MKDSLNDILQGLQIKYQDYFVEDNLENLDEKISDIAYCTCLLFKKSKESENLAIRILLSEKYQDLSPDSMLIRIMCFSVLINELKEKTIINEFKAIKKFIKASIFKQSSNKAEILETIWIFQNNEELVLLNSKFPKLERIINPEKIADLATYLKSVRYLDSCMQKASPSSNPLNFLDIIPNNPKLLMNLKKLLFCSQFKNELQNKLKYQLIQHIDHKIEEYTNSVTVLERFCLKVDKKFKEILEDVDNIQETLVEFKNCMPLSVPEITVEKLEISREEIDCLRGCENSYKRTPVGHYADFEDLFGSMLVSILDVFCTPRKFYHFYCLNQVSSLKFKLSEKYRVLKRLPINVSSTIMEMMLNLKKNKSRCYIAKFFVTKVKVPLYNCSVANDTIDKYLKLLSRPILFSAISQFYKGKTLREDLEKILGRLTIMKLPKKVSGFFLKTHHIALKMFKKVSKVHQEDAHFLIFLHELVQYLQRSSCKIVEECNHVFSPEHNNGEKRTEVGSLLEIQLFGYVASEISLEQAEFLMGGNYPETIDEFQAMMRSFSNVSNNSTILKFREEGNSISLGKCGFRVFNWTSLSFE